VGGNLGLLRSTRQPYPRCRVSRTVCIKDLKLEKVLLVILIDAVRALTKLGMHCERCGFEITVKLTLSSAPQSRSSSEILIRQHSMHF
jgi:hypothetical protein